MQSLQMAYLCRLTKGKHLGADSNRCTPLVFRTRKIRNVFFSISCRDAEIVEVMRESSPTVQNDGTNGTVTNSTTQHEAEPKSSSDISPTNGTLQLNKPSGLSLEDPVKLMDSILSENGAISQNINLLGK